MFLHDIGKPECHIRRYSKLYKREVDSFFNHNIAGVKIAARVLREFGFDEKHPAYFINNYILPLIDEGKLKYTIPEKPKSKNQKIVVADN